jgi:cytochrome P450
MLSSPDLPESDKKMARLALEVRTFVGAGTETTGNTLSSITFYLLANPDKAKRLKEEITEAQKKKSTPLVYQDLLHLPYLVFLSPSYTHFLFLLTQKQNAVILEGLRYLIFFLLSLNPSPLQNN